MRIMVSDIFAYATRNKLRFKSAVGDITVEQLWDVPLRASNAAGVSLDAIAKNANKALKDATEESFVETHRTKEHVRLEMTLEVVKAVIEVKKEEENKAKRRAEAKKEEEMLLQALANKQGEKLDAMTEAQIQKRLKAIKEESIEA
jgi:hypothetical protein